MLTTKSSSNVNIFKAGELASFKSTLTDAFSTHCLTLIKTLFLSVVHFCSMTLVTGLMILLRSATRITHKGQAITSLAAKWHVCSTIDYFDANEPETPAFIQNGHDDSAFNSHSSHGDSDGEDSAHDDELDNMKLIPAFTYSSISFQKRQALGGRMQLTVVLEDSVLAIQGLVDQHLVLAEGVVVVVVEEGEGDMRVQQA